MTAAVLAPPWSPATRSARTATAVREVLGAVKRWEDLDPSGVARQTYYVVFRRDRIEHLVSDGAASITAAKTVRVVDNPLEVVPVVPFVNADRVMDVHGVSEIEDLIPLLDSLNKVVSDMLVASGVLRAALSMGHRHRIGGGAGPGRQRPAGDRGR